MSKYADMKPEQLEAEQQKLITAQQKVMKTRASLEAKSKKQASVIQEELDKVEQERRSR